MPFLDTCWLAAGWLLATALQDKFSEEGRRRRQLLALLSLLLDTFFTGLVFKRALASYGQLRVERQMHIFVWILG